MSQLRPVAQSSVRCREIGAADVGAVVDLLTEGYGNARSRRFWVRALDRLGDHPTPPGFPRYGYLLESDGVLVGAILQISTAIQDGGENKIRCNGSSVYVKPAFRAYGAMLISRTLKHRHATYLNVTPDAHTWPMLDVQGYKRYSSGRVIAIPALGPRVPGTHVQPVTPALVSGNGLSSSEVDLLVTHASYGCLSMTCSAADGRHPFVFAPRLKYGVVPFAFLIYCRTLDEFVRFSGPLGRFLCRRGIPLVVVDANGPIPGLIGRYSNVNPKYVKGPDQARLGDLAYTERAMFGV